ncbi:MAG: TolC family protein [Myxococcales bacterium]|jgi:outer membrane protein
MPMFASLLLAIATATGPLGTSGVPLSLDDALAGAARNNPDLQLARLQGESADAQATASWAGVLPRLDLTAGFGRIHYGAQERVVTAPAIGTEPATGAPTLTFEQNPVETPAREFANYSLGLQLQQPLFDGFRSWTEIEKAKAGVEEARHALDETQLAVAFEVTRRFYEVVKAQQGVKVLTETVALSDSYVQRARALFEAGRGAKSELIAAQVNLGADLASLESQRAQVVQAWTDLALAIGRDAGQPLEVIEPEQIQLVAHRPLSPLGPLAELIEKAKASRPAVARARAALEAATLDKRIASADRYPTVGLGLSYERSGPNFTGSEGVYGNPVRQYVASAQLYGQWNIFNGGRTSAAEQAAAIAGRRARIALEQAEQQVAAEVARAYAAVVSLTRTVELSDNNLASAKEGVRLSTERLGAGVATQLEVRDASLKLTSSHLDLVNARIDLIIARAEPNRAVGGGL